MRLVLTPPVSIITPVENMSLFAPRLTFKRDAAKGVLHRAVPRRARMQGSWNFVLLNSRLESNKEEEEEEEA